jgi:hypothetical protein
LANLFEIPNFIKATSPQGLRRLMLAAQRKDNMQYIFNNIQFVDGAWFAWYIKKAVTDTDKANVIKDILGGE